MKFVEDQTPTKLRGGYYTPPPIADFLTRWLLEIQPKSFLEPSCGDGAFIDSLARLCPDPIESVVACEINPEEAAKANCRLEQVAVRSRQMLVTDFLGWSLDTSPSLTQVDAVLGNPPYVRYQYLPDYLQERARRVFERAGLHFTKHTNAWVPFVVASIAHLRPGGRLAMVIPAELLHVPHAKELRKILLAECSRVLVIDPVDLLFDGVLQGIVLLLAEKRGVRSNKSSELAIVPVKGRGFLHKPPIPASPSPRWVSTNAVNGKWMTALLTDGERRLATVDPARPHVKRFDEVASVDVGIVTGANAFFLVPDDVVSQHELQKWARPMFGRSSHVRGVIFDDAVLDENRIRGLPTNFLWFGDTEFEDFPVAVRDYIRLGEAQGLPDRYKCRIRSPWYNVPSVYASPVGMLKRCHHFPRLIHNQSRSLTTDTCYRVSTTLPEHQIVSGFVNSLTALSAELEGRHYGGGVLELVPSEIERLLIPVVKTGSDTLLRLDRDCRSGLSPEVILEQQDALVLGAAGFAPDEIAVLSSAWLRLRKRRQRS